MSNLYVESGGSWSAPKAVSVFQNGAWQPVKQIYVNYNGVWYPVWTNWLIVDITANTTDFNLYNYMLVNLAKYGLTDLNSALKINVVVHPSVVMGASSTATHAFDSGFGWAAGTQLKITVMSGGYIVGAGGDAGGNPWYVSPNGKNGGDAIRLSLLTFIDNQGTIGGGGGGGGAGWVGDIGYWQLAVGCGGGGAGSISGAAGQIVSNYWSGYTITGVNGGPGTLTYGGYYSYATLSYSTCDGGLGGSLGQAGANGIAGASGGAGAGGAPGNAIVGINYVTWINQGNTLGPTISKSWPLVEIGITSNTTDFNLYNYISGNMAALGLTTMSIPMEIVVTLSPGVVMGASIITTAGFNSGNGFAAGTRLRIMIGSGAYIVGAGGHGGDNPIEVNVYGKGTNATAGGPGLITTIPTDIDNAGTIAGGGGGGGSVWGLVPGYSNYTLGTGGGGAGSTPGLPGGNGNDTATSGQLTMTSYAGHPTFGWIGYSGSLTTGGTAITLYVGGYSVDAPYSSNYAKGGDLGQPGNAANSTGGGTYYPPGAAGNAILNSIANIAWIAQGTVLGPTS